MSTADSPFRVKVVLPYAAQVAAGFDSLPPLQQNSIHHCRNKAEKPVTRGKAAWVMFGLSFGA